MFANCLAAALRNLTRNWFYAGVMVLSLALGLATTILVGLYVRDELTYDRFLPGHEQVYRVFFLARIPNQPPLRLDIIQPMVAPTAKLADKRVVAAARLVQAFPEVRGRRGDPPIVDQTFVWADPEIFRVLPLPALAGNPATALERPDSVAITRKVARTYFHQDAPLGATLWVDGKPLRVTAVLKDLPANTHLVAEVYASNLGTRLRDMDARMAASAINSSTYLRLADGDKGDWLDAMLVDKVARPMEAMFGGPPRSVPVSRFEAVKLSDVHMRPQGVGDLVRKPSGDRAVLAALTLLAGLTLSVATINFVTLMTARAGRRAVEVGVRKAAGASRGALILQFIGEAVLYALVAAVAALALVELSLKPFGALVQQPIALAYLKEPGLVLAVVLGTFIVGAAAGLYPAFVLSGFRPAAVLKGVTVKSAGSTLARQMLVVAQFAVLIGLVVATTNIYRQTQFAVEYGLGDTADRLYGVWTNCNDAFPDRVRGLAGVEAVACSSLVALNSPAAISRSSVQVPGKGAQMAQLAAVDYGLLEMLNMAPIAGRSFSRQYSLDGALGAPGGGASPSIIINETAVRRFGFASPKAALGQSVTWPQMVLPPRGAGPGVTSTNVMRPSQIVGVVPDRPASVRVVAEPAIYFVDPRLHQMMVVKTEADRTAQAVASIRKLWKSTGHTRPIQEAFMSEARRNLYRDVIIQGLAIAVCSGLALFIAGLGLFALSAFTAERRTKEIGVRKAMGASTRDVLKLLLWQFTAPVLIANLIAWPVAFLVMRRWLDGFAYRVGLAPWTFLAAGAAALAIAWATVFVHALKVARAKPVGALRYE